MNNIRTNREVLLETVQKNRAKHRGTVQAALTKYREAAIAELDKMIADAKAGRVIRRSINLIEPMDQTKEYDRVILMLQMSVEEVIEIDEESFKQYVTDDWHWSNQFNTINSTYLAS